MLVDIGLPGIDGYEIARRVRADPALARVKLVALTGYGLEEDKQRSMAAGFDHHLVKPVDLATLQTLVPRLAGETVARRATIH
jgi:CheY-like chemotaxis protein